MALRYDTLVDCVNRKPDMRWYRASRDYFLTTLGGLMTTT